MGGDRYVRQFSWISKNGLTASSIMF